MLRTVAAAVRCMHVARVLQSYIDGEVSQRTVRTVEEHLEECRRCGLEASTYTAIKMALAASDEGETPSVDADALARLAAFAQRLGEEGELFPR